MPEVGALVQEPMHVFCVLAGVGVAVYWASGTKLFRSVFTYAPPVVWLYFIPLILTTSGITPSSSPLYGWMSTYLLPVSLLLITISVDLPGLAKIGRPALIVFAAGTLGVMVGSVLAFAMLKAFLPADAWQSLSMLSASWIGGSANMLSIHQSLEADPSLFGPIVLVDTVVGYGWLGVLVALSSYQAVFDRWMRADRSGLDKVLHIEASSKTTRRPVELRDIVILILGAFAVAILCRAVAKVLPKIGDPVIVSASTWAIILVVTLGLLLSFTRVRKLEQVGASNFGYAALFLLLTSVGAQADFRAIFEAPALLIAGLIVMATHIAFLLVAAYLIRAPFFYVATGSMANIGGAVSAPVAASAYAPSLAPLGALLGVLGYIVGIYLPILVSGVLASIAGA